MKKLQFMAMIFGLSLFFIACRKSNATPSEEKTGVSTENPAPSLNSILIAGSWAVDFYYDEEDKSTDFTGFVFTFKADSSLVFKKNNESYSGGWKILNEEGVTKLFININTINIVQKLNDKWQLKTYNSSKLEMKNDDPARSEFLNLRKL